MTEALTSTELQMLHNIRSKADELARLIQEANASGFNVNFNMNAALGTCDVFEVVRLVKVDLRSAGH